LEIGITFTPVPDPKPDYLFLFFGSSAFRVGDFSLSTASKRLISRRNCAFLAAPNLSRFVDEQARAIA
jgi:hypothetical protein